MSAESILVAGGAGYIGSHACKALAKAGYAPVTLDDLSTGHADAVRWGPLVQADIRDVEVVRGVVREHAIGAVMHFAASIEVGESVARPDLYYDNNVVATLRLLEALTAEGVRHIVFSSTAAVYGEAGGEPIPEHAPLKPANPYGETKRIIEGALRWWGAAKGFSWCALRYFNAAGADEDAEIGERHDPESHLIPNLVRAALGTGPKLRLFGTDYPTPDGSAVRDYVHVADLAEAHVAALSYLKRGGDSRAFNLGTGSGYSVLQIIDAAQRVLGAPPPFDVAARRPGDSPTLVADADAAKTLLQWTPTRSSIETILATAATFERSRPQTG
jgi:UDP-glucose-4-epimerase GalE